MRGIWAGARRAGVGVLGCLLLGPWAVCHAASLRFCDRPPELAAGQQDTLLRFGAIIKDELERSGQPMALVARSGLDLGRFGVRYSHAGLSLKASRNTPWSVRQLYYACDEKRPRLYDQGMAGFLLGTDDPAVGYVSVLLLPAAQAEALERVALDDRQVLRLLGATYSANAYAFSERYQNCNQWVAELLATAWGSLGEESHRSDPIDLRLRAQQWLKDRGYLPSVLDVGNPLLMWAGLFVPWVHSDDHPREDLAEQRYQVSMPASIEAFVHATLPQATRIEFCHAGKQVVIRRGWDPIAEGCLPRADDTVVTLE